MTRNNIMRGAALVVLVSLAAAFFYFGLHRHLTLDSLKANHEWMANAVGEHVLIAAAIFVAAYAVVVALSIPGAVVMTLAGGLLFHAVLGGLLAVIGATLGATIVFLAARGLFGALLRDKAGPFVQKLEAGFRANAFYYLLFLRLVPGFPFWVVNLVPAFLGVSLAVFVTATFIGIIPGTFVYASVGAGLAEIFAAGEDVSLRDLLTPSLIFGLLGLSVLSLMPIAIKKIRAQRHQSLPR